jgi:hypothetical protein
MAGCFFVKETRCSGEARRARFLAWSLLSLAFDTWAFYLT